MRSISSGMINLCFRGLAVPAVSDISPENKIFYNPNLKDYDYDLGLAAQLLDEAGYRMIRPGVRGDPQGHPLVFNLTTNTGVDVRDRDVRDFQARPRAPRDHGQLPAAGIHHPGQGARFVSFDWDCVLIGFTGRIEPNNGADFLRSSGNLHLWNPAQPKPATPWEAEIDHLLDQGTTRDGSDPDARRIYWRIQEILHDQLPIIETVRQS